ncbi:MAG: ligase-associated DNA damage response endonuclease PdeM [Notoacmeibacter sp.]
MPKQITVEIGQLALVLDAAGIAYLPDEATLLVADLHFEKASSLAKRGVYLPPYDTADTLRVLALLIAKYQPRRVICLGDSFHDATGHERLSDATLGTISTLSGGRDWVWISGNHDPENKANLPGTNCSEIELRSVILRHEPQFAAGEFEISGHLHPCARIEQRSRSLRRRCFAVNQNHLVLPAFGALTGSLNVLDMAYRGMMACSQAKAIMLGQTAAFAISAKRLLPD